MKVKVIAFGDIRRLIGKQITVKLKENATLEDLISKLTLITRTFRKGYIGPYKLNSNLIVLLNGRNVDTLEGPFSLSNGDIVSLIPLSFGG